MLFVATVDVATPSLAVPIEDPVFDTGSIEALGDPEARIVLFKLLDRSLLAHLAGVLSSITIPVGRPSMLIVFFCFQY